MEFVQALYHLECNILCFRYLPIKMKEAPPEVVSGLQARVRAQLICESRYYITGTHLDGQYCLRITAIHPLSSRSDLEGLLREIRRIGGEGEAQ